MLLRFLSLFCLNRLKHEQSKMGITKTLIRAGNGVLPKRGQSVTVHCTGYGKNGDLSQKFWSTKDPGQEPFTFKVGMGQVIKVRIHIHMKRGKKEIHNAPTGCIFYFVSYPNQRTTHTNHQGWDEGVAEMSIGEVAKIHCSPDYAYGPGGFPSWGIQPNSELIFEIEVLNYS